jgi:ABC-2 type transport system permease protein
MSLAAAPGAHPAFTPAGLRRFLAVFSGDATLAIGEWTRRSILVFIIPLALMMVDLFVWSWSPGWLDARINRAMMLIEPGGFCWLN